MVDAGGYRIGFFGLLAPETDVLSSPGPDITFAAPVETARAAVQRLEAAGADVIVALTHDDLADDRDLARQVEAIDLILGGHDHDPMTFDDGGTLIVKAGHDAHYLAAVDLAVERVQRGGEAAIEVVPTAWRYVRPPGSRPTRRSRRWSPATRSSWTRNSPCRSAPRRSCWTAGAARCAPARATSAT